MKRIHAIDRNLNVLFRRFDQIARDLKFGVPRDLRGKRPVPTGIGSGIYLIEVFVPKRFRDVKSWKDWFTEKWEGAGRRFKFVPNSRKGRLDAHDTLRRWMPIYLGRSGDLAHRIWEHLNLKPQQPTGSLKIRARRNMAKQRFRVSVLGLSVDNYAVIAPKLESALREIHQPILGRQ